jgi:negative regulator of sigma E activity
VSNTRKLAKLRAHTDRDVLTLIHRELDSALKLADAAESEKTCAKAITLRNAPEVRQEDRERIEVKVKELRRRLDRLPAAARASFAA